MSEREKGLQFPVREFGNWSVKEPYDQIALMWGNQARHALWAILEGKSIKSAIALGYTYPPTK